jgi:6-phosphogluconolactonase
MSAALAAASQSHCIERPRCIEQPRCIELREFLSSEALAAALARTVAGKLQSALQLREQAVLAVSGGTTPGRFFRDLAQQPLDWTRVTITLVDERWVPLAHPRSNEGALRTALQGHAASSARIVSLYNGEATPEQARPAIEQRIAALPPFDAVVLGMGTDGHTASFFADGDQLAAALDPHACASVVSMRAASAGEPRISLSLSRLIDARAVYLHIEGEDKLGVFQDALDGDEAGAQYPIRAVLTQTRSPLVAYWCP